MKRTLKIFFLVVFVIIAPTVGVLFFVVPYLKEANSQNEMSDVRSEMEGLIERYKTEVDSLISFIPPEPPSLADLYEKNKSAVLFLLANGASGSGFIISPDGLAVTNYHVVENTRTSDWLIFNGSGQEFEFDRVIEVNAEKDYAILRLKKTDTDFNYLNVASSDVKIGDVCFAIGNPKGVDFTLSDGIVSQIRNGGNKKLIQNTVPIDFGSSGGPLFDHYGNVIGITTGGLNSSSADLNFAVDINELRLYRFLNNDGFSEDILISENESDDPYAGLVDIVYRTMLLYYKYLDSKDYSEIEPMLATRMKHFSFRNDISRDLVMNLIRQENATIKKRETVVFPNSISLEVYEGGVQFRYRIKFSITSSVSGDTQFYSSDMVAELDPEGSILTIQQKTLKKL
jgi:serine protease Do